LCRWYFVELMLHLFFSRLALRMCVTHEQLLLCGLLHIMLGFHYRCLRNVIVDELILLRISIASLMTLYLARVGAKLRV